MPDPTKEEQIKAALLQVRALLFPDLKLIISSAPRRRVVAKELNEVFVAAVKELMDEIAEQEHAE